MKNNFGIIIIIVLILMALISLTQLLSFGIAGYAVLLGIALLFIEKIIKKLSFSDCGLEITLIGINLKNIKIYLWILLPVLMNFISIFLSKIICPEFIPHLSTRIDNIVSLNGINILFFLHLFISAFGEEIAWRAFFQNKISNFLPIIPAIIITSMLFAIGHISEGFPTVIIYDIFFVFINSIIYGIIFHKTNNAWINFFSHIIANITSIGILMFIK